MKSARSIGSTLPLALLVVALLGCTSPPPQPTPTASPNAVSCKTFIASAERFADLSEKATAGGVGHLTKAEDDELSAFSEVYDSVADRSQGELKEAILEVAQILRSQGAFEAAADPDHYLASVEAVTQICATDG